MRMPWETSVIQQLFYIRKARDAVCIIKVTNKWKSRGFPWFDSSHCTCCCSTRLLCLEHGSAQHPESIFRFCYVAPRLKPGLVNEENASSWVKYKPKNLSEDCVHFPLAIKKACHFLSLIKFLNPEAGISLTRGVFCFTFEADPTKPL